MCGIVGFLTQEGEVGTFRSEKYFKQGLYTDALRGWDSTGVFLITSQHAVGGQPKKRSSTSFKLATPASYFCSSPAFKSLMNSPTIELAIGHNRAATKGLVIDQNAHPFTHGNITLVHNGSLTNHKRLADGNRFEVDSEYIAYAFNKWGVKDTLKKIDGAFALVWYDKSNNTLNMVRNGERDLYVANNKGGFSLYYASEGKMLEWLADRNSISLAENSCSLIQTNMWYRWNVGGSIKPKVQAVEFKPIVNHWVNQSANTGYNSGSHSMNRDLSQKKTLDLLGLRLGDTLQHSFLDVNEKGGTRVEGFSEEYPDASIHTYPFYVEDKELLYTADYCPVLLEGKVIGASMEGGYPVIRLRDLVKTKIPDPYYSDEITGKKTKTTKGVKKEKKPGKFGLKGILGLEDKSKENKVGSKGDEKEKEPSNVLSLYRGPKNNEYISQKAYINLVSGGCIFCGDNIDIEQHATQAWSLTVPYKPICDDCVADHLSGFGDMTPTH